MHGCFSFIRILKVVWLDECHYAACHYVDCCGTNLFQCWFGFIGLLFERWSL